MNFRQGSREPRAFPRGSSLLFFAGFFCLLFSEGGNWHFIYLWVCYDSGLTDTTLSKLSLFTNGKYFNLIAPYHPTPEPRASSSPGSAGRTLFLCRSDPRLMGMLPYFPIPAWLRAQPSWDRRRWEPGRTHRHQIYSCQPRLGVPDPGKSWGAGNAKGGRVEVAGKRCQVGKNEV